MLHRCKKKRGVLIDYEDITHDTFAPPREYRSINDTVGYGIVLGLVWKLVGACRYWYVQLLQVILFSVGMWLLYDVALLLFGNTQIALFCCVAQLLFFPLVYLNVQALRDVWAYYAIVVLLYGLLSYVKNGRGLGTVVVCAVLFALLQGIRPTVFFTLLTVSCAMMWWLKDERKKRFTHNAATQSVIL